MHKHLLFFPPSLSLSISLLCQLDPVLPYRYFIAHSEGVHMVTLPWAGRMTQFATTSGIYILYVCIVFQCKRKWLWVTYTLCNLTLSWWAGDESWFRYPACDFLWSISHKVCMYVCMYTLLYTFYRNYQWTHTYNVVRDLSYSLLGLAVISEPLLGAILGCLDSDLQWHALSLQPPP